MPRQPQPETPIASTRTRPAPPLPEVRRVLSRFRRDAQRTRERPAEDPVKVLRGPRA